MSLVQSKNRLSYEPTSEDVARLYDENSDAWSRGVRAGEDWFREFFHDPAFFSLLEDNLEGSNILDLCCGEGILCRKLALKGANMFGVDISPGMIASATAEARGQGLHQLQFEVASAQSLTLFPDENFDQVVSVMALMDTPELSRVFPEVYRVLKPKGSFLFSVAHPFSDTYSGNWKRVDDRWEFNTSGYFDNRAWIDEWYFSSPEGGTPEDNRFKILTFPHTDSEYVNFGLDAGFHLSKMLEPVPQDNLPESHKGYLERWREIPFYLMLRLYKE